MTPPRNQRSYRQGNREGQRRGSSGSVEATAASVDEAIIKALTELVAKLTGFDGTIAWDASKPDGQPRRCLDVSRAREQIGFVAGTTLEDGLRKTIAWYEQHAK